MNQIKQVDKDVNYMKSEFGTVCLITETGRADRILDFVHRRQMNKERLVDRPLDAWEI